MTNIDKERDRLDQLEKHIEEAEERARDILEPHANPEGGQRTLDPDRPEEEERVEPGS
jgi:hypothetical protein